MIAPTLTLHSGVEMPQLGLGTWPMDDREAARVVPVAIECGYRLFDTASRYGNERGVGAGMRAGGVPREELFVTTKLLGLHHGYDATLAAFDESAARLGVDYVDLYLIHWPLAAKELYVETWRAFERLLADGRVRAIGVSNFDPSHIDRLVAETGVAPAVNQVELHPYFQQYAVRAYDAANGIVTQTWSPLGRAGDILRDPVVDRIADAHGRTPGQIVLRWHIDLGLSPVPKSSDPDRLAANIEIFDFALSAAEMSAIAALDRGARQGGDPETHDEE